MSPSQAAEILSTSSARSKVWRRPRERAAGIRISSGDCMFATRRHLPTAAPKTSGTRVLSRPVMACRPPRTPARTATRLVTAEAHSQAAALRRTAAPSTSVRSSTPSRRRSIRATCQRRRWSSVLTQRVARRRATAQATQATSPPTLVAVASVFSKRCGSRLRWSIHNPAVRTVNRLSRILRHRESTMSLAVSYLEVADGLSQGVRD